MASNSQQLVDPFAQQEPVRQEPTRQQEKPKLVDPFAQEESSGLVDPFAQTQQPEIQAKTPADDYSYLESTGRNLKGGFADLASGMGSVSGYLGERFDSDTLRQTGESMKDYWGDVAESAPMSEAAQTSPFDDPKVLADPRWWTENVSRMAPSFAIPAGVAGGGMKIASKALPGLPRIATALGAGVGGLFGGSIEGAQTYEAGLESGQPEETAARAGEAMALGSAVLNALPLYKIMNPSARGIVYNFLTRGMTEGVTEAMEEPLDEIIQGLVYDKEMDWEDVARRAAQVAPPAFLLGGVAGGGQGVTQPQEPAPGEGAETPEGSADITGTVDDSIEDIDATGGDASQVRTADDLAETETGVVDDVALTGEDALAQQVEQEFGQPGMEVEDVTGQIPTVTEQADVVPISGEEIVMEGPAPQPVDEEITMEGPAQPDLSDTLEHQGLTPAERQRTIQALEQELEPAPAQPETVPAQAPQEADRAVQPTPKAQPSQSRQGFDPTRDSITEAVAKLGGINRDDVGGDLNEGVMFQPDKRGRKQPVRAPGTLQPIVRANGGMTLDGMAENLSQYGYPVTDETGAFSRNALIDAINEEATGRPVYSNQRGPESLDAELEESARSYYGDEVVDGAVWDETAEEMDASGETLTETQAEIRSLIPKAMAIDEGAAETALERETDAEALKQLQEIINGQQEVQASRQAVRPEVEGPKKGRREEQQDAVGGQDDTALKVRQEREKKAEAQRKAPPMDEGEGDLFSDKSKQQDVEDVTKKPAAPSKESWEMTALEYTQSRVPGALETSPHMQSQHKVEVKAAIGRGEKVPERVLAEYPDLQEKPAQPEKTESQPPQSDLVGKYVRSGSTTGRVTEVSEDGKKATLDTGRRVPVGKAPNWTVQDEPFEGAKKRAAKKKKEKQPEKKPAERKSRDTGRDAPMMSQDQGLTKQSVAAFAKSLKNDLGLETLSLSYRPDTNTLVLNNMVAPRKGQGTGTQAMERLTEFADRNAALIVLSPGQQADGTGTTSRNRLVRFYKRHGFVENKGRNKDFEISESMYREPQTGMFAMAYHGSPHKWDRVDLSKVGTGEGGAAFGWGFYAGEHPGTGEFYANLNAMDPDLRDSNISIGDQTLTAEEFQNLPEAEQRAINQGMGRQITDDFIQTMEDRGEPKEFVDALEKYKGKRIAQGGTYLYKIEIPDSAVDNMLNWDAPLSEQPGPVKEALSSVGISPTKKTPAGALMRAAYDMPESFVGRKGATKEDVSKKLYAAGISGIKYLDQGSRTQGEGTRNFVVFDDSLITILERNGEPVTGAEREQALMSMAPGDVTQTEAFRRWFQDSKVVDENGEPLVVYHGTSDEGFTEFQTERAGEIQYSDWGPGIYLTPSEDQADRYRVEALKEIDETSNAAFARLEAAQAKQEWRNGAPVQSDEVDAALAEFRRARKAAGESDAGRVIPAYVSIQNPYIQEAASTANSGVGQMAREQGHDGIIVLKPDGSIDEVIAFQSEQIKSVDNRGTFDPNDPNILRSTGRGTGMSTEAAHNALRQILGKKAYDRLVASGRFEILQTPQDLGEGMESVEGRTQGFYEPIEDKSYLFANNISPKELWGVFLHEVGAHYGLPKMIGREEYNRVLKQLKNLHKLGNKRVVAAYNKVPEATSEQAWWDEVLAYMVQDRRNHNMNPIRRIIAKIKEFLRKRGYLKAGKLSPDEITRLVEGAARHAARTAPKSATRGGQEGTALQSAPADTFYSQMERVLQDKLPNKGTPETMNQQVQNLAKKGQFKQEEYEWSGIDQWLDGLKGRKSKVVTKAEVLDFLRANRIRVEEVTKGGPSLVDLRARFQEEGYDIEQDEQAGDTHYVHPTEGYIDFAELPDHLQEEVNRVSGSMDTAPKFADYQLPGGEGYRELLLTLPYRETEPLEYDVKESAETGKWDVVDESGRVVKTRDNYRAALDDAINMSRVSVDKQEAGSNFLGGHYDEPNVLAHVRFNERTDADGKRVLFVEEVQSDWMQSGRKRGFAPKSEDVARTRIVEIDARLQEIKNAPAEEVGAEEQALWQERQQLQSGLTEGVPNAPFKQTWPLLAMKRMIRFAAENGFDSVAWTTGEQQAARYDLSKQVDKIVAEPLVKATNFERSGTDIAIHAGRERIMFRVDDNGVVTQGMNNNGREVEGKALDDVVGKELAEKLLAVEGQEVFSGADLKVGGEGMKAFYDKMLPSALNKYVKKWGARVGETDVGGKGGPQRVRLGDSGSWRVETAEGELISSFETKQEADDYLDKLAPAPQYRPRNVHALPITPQMREAVMEVGQPLFSKEGELTPEQKRERLRRLGLDFENLPGDPEGSQARPRTPEDVEPEAVDPETALEQLEKQGFDKPMLSVDEDGREGALPEPDQQERAQRSLTGNRANNLTTDEDGLLDVDPRMDPLSKDLIKTVGFFESATDKLRRSNHPILQNLAQRVDTYYDRNEARMGWVNGRVRPILKRIPMTQKKHVMRDFKDYWRHFDNGREQEATAILNRNTLVRELVSEVKRLYSEMGDVNQKVGVQVYDAGLNGGKGGWRGIGKVPPGKFWPRAFSPEVQRVLSNPKNDPKLWDKLVDALIDEGHIETREEADKYLRRYMGREVANDYFSGIEKARQRKLPEVFYDYSWDAFNRYARKWSSRVTQIEQFGQKTGPGSEDVFEQVINSTKDQHTQNYVAALSDHVYSRRSTDIYTTLLQHLNLIATGTQLGNPATATLNFIGGTTLNVQMFGWRRVAKSYATMMQDWKKIQQTGVDLGILGKDVLNILRDTEQSAATYMDASGRVQDSLARFAAFTMKWGGYKGTENIIRMNAMMSSWMQLQDALQQWNRNPKSSTSMKYRAFMQRNRIDPDRLLAENGKGPETARYLRRMVNIPQGSYRPDMVPLYVDSPVGRFLFKYQKFGTQVSRMFWQNHLQPFVKTVVGGEKVLLPGQKLQPKTGNIIDEKTGKVVKSNRVRTFLPLLRYFAAALLGGSAILAARSFMFNYNDPGPEWDDLAEALDDDEEGEDRSLMWAMIFDRAYYSLFAASAAGFFGNYIQFGMDFADQQRVKNPLDPPGLASIDAVVELVMRSQEQGKLTARDLDNIGERTLALYRGYKRMGTKAMAMSGSGWKEARLRDAYTDLVYTKKMTRRFADQMDMKGRRTFSGRWGKTPMSPYNQQAYEALLLGDPESARAAYEQAKQAMEEPGKVAQSMKSSVRARHPWNVGASQARANHSKFLEWAKKHTSKANYQRIRELGDRYDKARKSAGL